MWDNMLFCFSTPYFILRAYSFSINSFTAASFEWNQKWRVCVCLFTSLDWGAYLWILVLWWPSIISTLEHKILSERKFVNYSPFSTPIPHSNGRMLFILFTVFPTSTGIMQLGVLNVTFLVRLDQTDWNIDATVLFIKPCEAFHLLSTINLQSNTELQRLDFFR